MAIEQALTVLNWYENLPKEDVPPEHLWEDVEGLEAWWATVEDRRSDGAPSVSTDNRSDGDSRDGTGEAPRSADGSGMAQNDLARYLKAKG